MALEHPHLIWIDCEMTGLDLEKDVLVEIAVLVTDSELNVIGEGVDVVIKATDAQLAAMNEYVTEMHTNSGLIAEIPKGISAADAEATASFIQEVLNQQRAVPAPIALQVQHILQALKSL